MVLNQKNQSLTAMSDPSDIAPPSKRFKLSDDAEDANYTPVASVPAAETSEHVFLGEGWTREVECGLATFLNKESDPFTSIFKHRYVQHTVFRLL